MRAFRGTCIRINRPKPPQAEERIKTAVTALLPMVLAFLPAKCLAAESCPWMNAATAGGVLGGDPVVTVAHSASNKDDATCTFTRQQSAFTIEVRTIEVQTTEVQTTAAARSELASYGARCILKGEPLKGIGNEAVTCALDAAEQVVGRVRDRIFIVKVHTPDEMRVKAHFVAEQVAGNLF